LSDKKRQVSQRQVSRSGHKFETHPQIFSDLMTIRNDPQPEAPRDQVLSTALENDSEEKPDSSSAEKVEAKSMSYRRSRNVALMKLAFLRPEKGETA
jgi:hypothetical protein